MKNHFKRILFTKEQIEKKCLELAEWINEEYKDSKNLMIVGLLIGAIPFVAEVIKSVNVVHQLDFMIVSSYEGKRTSNGNPKIVMDMHYDIENKDILILEDIIDSGRSLNAVKSLLTSRKPNSFKTIVLINKKKKRKKDFIVDKYGFEVDDIFIAGFGLDVNEKLRNLPYIGEFDEKYLKEY